MAVRARLVCVARAGGGVGTRKKAVVVGGGMAGLASALALKKRGWDQVVVVERREESAAAAGSSLALWSNGWSALEALGVASALRRESREDLLAVELCTEKGETLRKFRMEECKPSNGKRELRGVRRGALASALKEALRDAGVSTEYGVNGVRCITSDSGDKPRLFLDSGEMSCDLLVVADGANSSLGRSLGVSPPTYAGYSAIRGVAQLPEDMKSKLLKRNTVRQLWGKGIRVGMYPLSEKEVYWFICFNAQAGEGKRFHDKNALATAALDKVKDWEEACVQCVRSTPPEDLSYSDISDRFVPPLGFSQQAVAFVGDANHPMTPNLGQGGCTALEDAVVLGSMLNPTGDLRAALAEYEFARAKRCVKLTVRANLMGQALQISNPLVCLVRDKLIAPKLFSPRTFLDHTVWTAPELTL